MATLVFVSLLLLLTLLPPSSSSTSVLTKGSSLSVQNSNDVLISPKGIFSAGFYPVGNNSFCFAIWLTKEMHDGSLTVVWMANRNQPVNGKRSRLSLLKNGNLILTDADQYIVWATQTTSNSSPVQLVLHDSGNLILLDSKSGKRLWQSFDFPTDTLLANQLLTRQTSLVSSRSSTNYSSGFYKLFFDYDNVLRLLFDGLNVSSIYWPRPWLLSWENGRSTYNSSRIAAFDSSGYFYSTDNLQFSPTDYGSGNLRRLTMDIDGNIRMYSLVEGKERQWNVTWQAIQEPCKIHGICGANALCTYKPHESKTGRQCSCLPGYKMTNLTDWAYGCKQNFRPARGNDEAASYLELPHVEFYGYDTAYYPYYTLTMCKNFCSNTSNCMGFQYKFSDGFYKCYPKSSLLNGQRSSGFDGFMYIKLPKILVSSYEKNRIREFRMDCSGTNSVMLERFYKKQKENTTLRFMVWFATSIGGIELLLICIFWCFLYQNHRNSDPTKQGYLQVGSGFRKFTYNDMKKATKNFSEEIGRGSGGIVYKGVLTDQRVAAIKRLNNANQGGEAEFLAEVSTIGKLNHMNLIEMWGYCVEGKHRLLVYEYMEHGSLEKNLSSKALDSKKRFNIAVGTARGLAYLHEECLEWVLHCDVKPQNVLLDTNFQPKVADFGLSKLFNRTEANSSNFSKIRGTRGYMAPEWIYNLAITSKVDVYSYGVVILEMVTGRSPMGGPEVSGAIETEQRGLVSWVRENMSKNKVNGAGIEEIIDPIMEGTYDTGKMKILVEVALECVEEDKDARPTMRQVLERLIQSEE